jgi:hypothetical protein
MRFATISVAMLAANAPAAAAQPDLEAVAAASAGFLLQGL